jgi:Uncharacterized protein involved in exopolysaccharide biosynthesis
MGKNKNKFDFNSIEFIFYVWSKRRTLITVSIFTFIISAVISFLITPKFKSAVILFPVTSSSITKSVIYQNGNPQDDILKFGAEQEGEQLIQILNSNEVTNRIIKKFKLAKHYKIDTTSAFWHTALSNEFDSNITFRRTEFNSVVISVLDISPDTAAAIANEISYQVDSVMTKIQQERAQKAFAVVEKEYLELLPQVKQLQDSLTYIRQMGVVDYPAQAKGYSEAYAKAIGAGRMTGVKMLEDKIKVLAKYGGTYQAVSQLLNAQTDRLSLLRNRYLDAKIDAEKTIPHKFVVEAAAKPEKKVYPNRMLIVLMSTISVFFVTLLLLMFRDRVSSKKI